SSRSYWWMSRTALALRITRTSTPVHPIYLVPFAMCQAFPGSDYYGTSVALGLSPFRRSRVPRASDVQDGLGSISSPSGRIFDPRPSERVVGGGGRSPHAASTVKGLRF